MYLKKKDLLEWVFVKISEYNQNEKDADAVCRFGEKERWRAKMQVLENMKRLVQSGAFDADNSEVQRLRAALLEIRNFPYETPSDDTRVVQRIADQALEGKSDAY